MITSVQVSECASQEVPCEVRDLLASVLGKRRTPRTLLFVGVSLSLAKRSAAYQWPNCTPATIGSSYLFVESFGLGFSLSWSSVAALRLFYAAA